MVLGAAEIDPNRPWYKQHIHEHGFTLYWEAVGPNNSTVVFKGPDAQINCEIFMEAIRAPKRESSSQGLLDDFLEQPDIAEQWEEFKRDNGQFGAGA